jgi:tellurite resistance protein TerC
MIEVFELYSMIKTLQQAKRIVKVVIGFTILLIGLAMTVLPGPAIVVIPAGLAILATEFLWAKRLLERIKQGASNSFNRNRH